MLRSSIIAAAEQYKNSHTFHSVKAWVGDVGSWGHALDRWYRPVSQISVFSPFHVPTLILFPHLSTCLAVTPVFLIPIIQSPLPNYSSCQPSNVHTSPSSSSYCLSFLLRPICLPFRILLSNLSPFSHCWISLLLLYFLTFACSQP